MSKLQASEVEREGYVNFADPHLFFAYGSPAFAQDEIQVAEDPILGSLREALLAEQLAGISPLTTEGERPTPILVRGAERWCAIDLDPDLAMPYGIYGRRLQQASPAGADPDSQSSVPALTPIKPR